MSQSIRDIHPDSFLSEVLLQPGLSVVKVWADWCVPCKAMAPKIERLAAEYTGRVNFVSLDAGAHLAFAKTTLKVSSIPALVCYQGGSVKVAYFGAGADLQLKDFLRMCAPDSQVAVEECEMAEVAA